MSLFARFFSLAILTALLAGCATDVNDNDMAPIVGAGAKPDGDNRFPLQRGGFAPSDADETDEGSTPIEVLRNL